jgi:hypothetical protein
VYQHVKTAEELFRSVDFEAKEGKTLKCRNIWENTRGRTVKGR